MRCSLSGRVEALVVGGQPRPLLPFLTLPIAKARGDSRFDATSLHRRSYNGSPSVPSCEEVRACPALPIRILGLPALRAWARTTCQVVQVHGLVLDHG